MVAVYKISFIMKDMQLIHKKYIQEVKTACRLCRFTRLQCKQPLRNTNLIVCDIDYCNIYRKLFKEY